MTAAHSAAAILIVRSLAKGEQPATDYADIPNAVKVEMMDAQLVERLKHKATGEMWLRITPQGWVAIAPKRKLTAKFMQIPRGANDA